MCRSCVFCAFPAVLFSSWAGRAAWNWVAPVQPASPGCGCPSRQCCGCSTAILHGRALFPELLLCRAGSLPCPGLCKAAHRSGYLFLKCGGGGSSFTWPHTFSPCRKIDGFPLESSLLCCAAFLRMLLQTSSFYSQLTALVFLQLTLLPTTRHCVAQNGDGCCAHWRPPQVEDCPPMLPLAITILPPQLLTSPSHSFLCLGL